MDNHLLSAALAYAARGWAIFPCHTVTAGLCSCGNPDPRHSRGKHPRTIQGFKDASTDPAVITRWWTMWPDSNIAVATGAVSGIVVLDVDPRHGGEEGLAAFEAHHGALPPTAIQHTGGGGRHFFFAWSRLLSNTAGALGPGLDTRGDGGYVLLAPSAHESGRPYVWDVDADIDDTALAPCPPGLWVTTARTNVPPHSEGGPIPEGTREATLIRMAGALRRQGASVEEILAFLHSVNTRCLPPLPEKDLQRMAQSIGRYTPHMFSAPETPPPAQSERPWQHNLLRKQGKEGEPGALLALLANFIMILHHDPCWHGVLGFDEFSEMVTLTAPPPYLPEATQGAWLPRPLRDTDDSETCAWIQQQYHCHASTTVVAEALEVVARKHPYHAVRDYLASLVWDGTPRLDTWLYTYAHAEDAPFVRAVASKTLISAVARVMDPGCQVDTVLVLEGEQGERKSAFIRALAHNRAWFSDDLPDLRDKDARQSLRGIWILELGELETLSKSEVETIKRFISAPSDFYRPSYGRRAMQFPRQTIFIGSTNRETYLKDDTGNRRFWPVRINTCNTEALEANRDQLWAEAFARYQRDEPWWLDQAMEQAAQSEQAKRVEFDEWVLPVMAYAKTQSSVLARDIFSRALSLDEQHHTPANARRIGAILRLHGWKPKVLREDGILIKRFVPPAAASPESAAAPSADTEGAPW